MTRAPSESFEATFNSGLTGLVGTVTFKIDDNEGNTVFGPTTAGILEIGVTGIYSIVVTAPADVGDYSMVWSEDGSYDEQHSTNEDLTVVESILGLSALPPLTDFGADGTTGPCSAWATRAAVASCCEGFADDTQENQDAAIRAATEILYELSGHRYPGECDSGYVRPCNQGCGCFGPWAYGLDFTWDPTRARWACDTHVCGCSPTSDVVLSGVPIREIEEVLIDGVLLDPGEYTIMEPNVLVRLRDVTEPHRRLVWPGCQIMDLPETEEGTFAIRYTYGADPPQAGRSAAMALACELWQACPSGSGECSLPEGVSQVVREGITMEAVPFIAAKLKTGQTGIAAIDNFVGLFSDAGDGPSSVWSPDLDYPRRFRTATGS